MKTLKTHKELFEAQENQVISEEIKESYRYKGNGSKSWMDDMMLSERACYDPSKKAFLVCKACHLALINHNEYPVFGIRNGWFPGRTPVELEELTEIELAFISPVRVHGHIVTYFGGEKGIRGWHSLLQCDIRSTARSLHGMERLNMPNRIAVVMSGRMTNRQRNVIKKKIMIRRDVCWRALQHQMVHNVLTKEELQEIDFDNLPDPILIDRSSLLEEEIRDSNVELNEQFTIVFPDSSLDEMYGGYNTIKEFKQVLEQVSEAANTQFSFTSRGREYAQDHVDENIVRAFPKQFPYGRGGPNEERTKPNGEEFKIPLDKFIEHVNGLSAPNFHTQMFSIVSYNILQRHNMLKKACWKLKDTSVLASKFCDVTDEELRSFVNNKRNGLPHGTLSAAKFIDLVDVITGALPHSNKAAMSARNDALALQAEFGFPAIFFSLTPDDSNSFVIWIYSGFEDGLSGNLDELDMEGLKARAKHRNCIRLKYPGMCALWFEAVLKLVLKHVIGWDMEKGKATEHPGYFGVPEAVLAAIEEQTRKRLHAHFIVFLKAYNKLMSDLQ